MHGRMKATPILTWLAIALFVTAAVLYGRRVPVVHLGPFFVRTYIVAGLLLSAATLALSIRNFLQQSKWMGFAGIIVSVAIAVWTLY